MYKIINPGRGKYGEVYFKIEFYDKKLSIHGVEGPTSKGGCLGSSGQISGRPLTLHKNWTQETLNKFYAIWDEWHLNDMRACCQHQKDWNKKPIDPEKPLNAYGKFFVGQKQDSWNMLAWIHPEEHPEGLLCKPCPVCGYKYGTLWLFEEVPNEVITWLATLPETKTQPAWI